MAEQLNLFDWQERIEQQIRGVHDEIVAYAGRRKRFTRRSEVPGTAMWLVYELLKNGMASEKIGENLRSRYPADFSNPGPSSLLPLVIERAYEEYVDSMPLTKYRRN